MKKVNFKRISILNFLSVGDEVVSVDFNQGLHVITGINYDKPDRRNAIGKSTIADAVYFAIFGETLRDIKKDLISNNVTSGNTHVELDFEVITPSGTNDYKIVRTLGPSKVFIYKNNKDKTRDSISNTNKYICNVTSASPSIFKNCVIMTVNNAIPFMAKNKVEKRKFIEDIFGMEVFSQMLSTLRAEYNDVKKEYEIDQSKLDELQKTYAEYIKQQDDILVTRKSKKSIYKSRQQNNIDELTKLNKELSQYKEEDLDKIEKSIEQLNNHLPKCDAKITEYVENISSEKAKIGHLKDVLSKIGTDEDTCPVCLKSIQDHDKGYINKEKEQLKNTIKLMVDGIKNVNESLKKCKGVKETICKAITDNNQRLSDAMLSKQRVGNINDKIQQIHKWQDELQVDLDVIESTNTDFDNLIESSYSRINELLDKVNKLKKHIANLDIVKYVVSEEGVKSYIVNRLLELLNSKLLQYLKRLDSNSICIFNEYFEEEIINEKNKVCSYFNFSGAERKSIDLACLFTFSDIRRLQGGVKYNLGIYDELFDSSFDEKGIEMVTQILQDRVKELDECTIVISHRKESIKAVTGDVIYLTKQNGITRRVAYTEI
tara:strand:- start:3055 stop:4860 length:1806 start_codon:yes stop_codon:yes gene_type:complete